MNRPLEMCVHCGCSSILNVSLENRALHRAVQCKVDHQNDIALLITKGADVNMTDSCGKTPLHLALERDNCNLGVIKLLLESGAKVNPKNITSSSALHFAVQKAKCEVEVMDLLFEHGAEIEAVNCIGDTPLLRALRNPNCTEDVIAWFLKHGANIERTNHFGRSVLHSIVENRECKVDMLKFLLKKKIPLNVLYSSGKSPLFRAIENRCHPEIVQTMLNAGAMMDYGNSTFEMAVRIALCDKTCSEISMRNLEMLVRYATLSSLDCSASKFIPSLWYFKERCRHNVQKMDLRDILPGVTFRDFLTGKRQLRFNNSMTEGELCDLGRIFHFIAADKYPMYTSVIALKLDIQDICDNLKMHTNTEVGTVWLDCHSVANVFRYLTNDGIFNSIIAFHSAEVCNECLG